ncbi:hypothetical protein RhiirC2_795131 [Rhizophagus irregularis]|uniref:Uncharacterized protein n=1 Tax=Rhizophagus irregularis TaxID=588596 RepID=A0A2N1MC70_9GLOM|nr:hypothetical protein RhiirC2_795131 [Rhizophagus irregularis]
MYTSLTEKENQILSLKKNLEEMTIKVNKELQEKDNYILFLKKGLEEMTNKANEEAQKNSKDNKVDCSTLLNNINNIFYIQRILINLDIDYESSDEYERHENCIKYLKAEYEKLTCIIDIENEKKLDLLEGRVDLLNKSILKFKEFLCKTI